MNSRDYILNVERLDSDVIAHAIPNFDANYSAIAARMLTQVRAKTLEVTHGKLNAFTVFPVQTEVRAGATTALQRTYDMVGMAKIVANPADDLPLADIFVEETSVKVKQLGIAYQYSVRDLQHAVFSNTPLSTMKASAARKANDVKINKIAWFGDKDNGIIGFLDNPNLSEYTLKNDGEASGTALSSKTAEKQFRDMNEFINTIQDNTDDTEQPNTVLLPPSAYTTLSSTLYTTADGQTTKTVLAMLKENHPEIKRWEKIGELKNADSTGAKDIMIVGYFDPDYIRLEIPNRFEQMPIQAKNLAFTVPCHSEVIGVTVFRPYCFTKAVGV